MKFRDLKMRLITSLCVGSFSALCIGFSSHPSMRIFIGLVLMGFAGVALWEYAEMLSKKNIALPSTLLILLGILTSSSFMPKLFGSMSATLPLLALGISVFILFLFYFNKIENATLHVASSVFGLVYIAAPLGILYRVLYPMTDKPLLQNGLFWLIYLISVTKITDITAYFTGKSMGRHKLAPRLSPGKTWEGTIFGVVGSSLLSVGFYSLATYLKMGVSSLPFIYWLMLGASLGVIGLIGDLAESLIKRDCGVKDSNQIPGLGGVMDLFDSLLFAVPFFYFVMRY